MCAHLVTETIGWKDGGPHSYGLSQNNSEDDIFPPVFLRFVYIRSSHFLALEKGHATVPVPATSGSSSSAASRSARSLWPRPATSAGCAAPLLTSQNLSRSWFRHLLSQFLRVQQWGESL